MPLLDEHTGVVDRLGHARLKYNGLQASLQEILNGESKHVIELVLTLIQKTISVHASQKSLSLENTTCVFLIESKQHASIVADTAQRILNPPELTLVAETILSNKLQLGIETLLLERPAWLLEGLSICVILGFRV